MTDDIASAARRTMAADADVVERAESHLVRVQQLQDDGNTAGLVWSPEEVEALLAYVKSLRSALASAKAEEREACARVADRFGDMLQAWHDENNDAGFADRAKEMAARRNTAVSIAFDIRSRKDTP